MAPCAVLGCVALAVPNSERCIAHSQLTRRAPGDAPIHCYACGKLIQIGYSWIVRDDGALHVRPECLLMPPAEWAIKVPA